MKYVLVILVMASLSSVLAQSVLMDGIHGNGTISWTNVANTNALYRIEWASSLSGPWHFSMDALGGGEFRNIQASTNTEFTAEIPMFFRVRIISNSPPLGMVFIPGGTFQMGDHFSEGHSNELPLHSVTLDSFWMGRTEVTRGEYQFIMEWGLSHGYQFDRTNVVGLFEADAPVYEINWYDAIKWCNAKSEMENRNPVYWFPDGMLAFVFRTGRFDNVEAWIDRNGYRLPTEAEWEYAARGGQTGKRFACGNTISHLQENYYADPSTYSYDISNTSGDNPFFTNRQFNIAPVGALAPNGYGLYDMSGNLREWCWDRYASNYYTWSAETNPTGPAGSLYPDRVIRGGDDGLEAIYCRISARYYQTNTWEGINGFRIAASEP